MKFFGFFFLFFVFFVAAQALTDEQKARLKVQSDACYAETGASRELVLRAKSGENDIDDLNVRKYLHCLLVKLGLMNSEGKIDRETALSKVDDNIKEAVGAAIDACKDLGGEDIYWTSWNILRCYREKRPSAFDF